MLNVLLLRVSENFSYELRVSENFSCELRVSENLINYVNKIVEKKMFQCFTGIRE